MTPVEELAPALVRLAEALDAEPDSFVRDALLHRFQVCFELCWKSAKQRLGERDIDCASPNGCLQAAARQGWLVEEPWLEMIEARNHLPSCTDEKIIAQILKQLPGFLDRMRELQAALLK